MRCHNYAHSDEEITRIRERAQSQRGYVDGSWIQADAGHDGHGGRLTLCSWRWATPQPGEGVRPGEGSDLVRGNDLVRGCGS